jgi:hypothetical protein
MIRLAVRIRTKGTPPRRAAKYLERIAALTGARQEHDGSYRLTAGGRDFVLDSRFVSVISSRDEATCFYIATGREIPSAEVIASALLELKNNPRLFEKWRKRRGSVFKANGKRFRGIRRDF